MNTADIMESTLVGWALAAYSTHGMIEVVALTMSTLSVDFGSGAQDPSQEGDREGSQLREAEQAGLTVSDASGHGHSTHVISGGQPHPFRVWSTPRNADIHARQIRRHIRRNT